MVPIAHPCARLPASTIICNGRGAEPDISIGRSGHGTGGQLRGEPTRCESRHPPRLEETVQAALAVPRRRTRGQISLQLPEQLGVQRIAAFGAPNLGQTGQIVLTFGADQIRIGRNDLAARSAYVGAPFVGKGGISIYCAGAIVRFKFRWESQRPGTVEK
jgi:hypothetical protein